MNRREFLRVAALAAAIPAVTSPARAADDSSSPLRFRVKPFELDEATILQLQDAMKSGRESAASLAKKYLQRIEEIDKKGPVLNAIIELNPDAQDIARDLDKERKEKGPRGPLHGVPILLKDNIDTHDRMTTTTGSLALLGSIAPRDSSVAEKLRAAGAVILGKTNLSEWANFRGERSSSGWSGRGGQTRNPYVLDRNPSGSSSGSSVAVSANLCAAAIGTETDGSIVSPSSVCGIVGIKPTVGLISRAGIIPISVSQDTAGPMTRTVRDAAILLGALTGADPRDKRTEESAGKAETDYTRFLDANGLRGARLGMPKSLFPAGAPSEKVIAAALDLLKKAGATVVAIEDDFPKLGKAGRDLLLYEFKAGVNAYLASLGPKAPVKSLKEVIEFNERNHDKELAFFGQQTMVAAQEKGPLTDPAYLDAAEKCRRLTRAEGIDAMLEKHQLDAIVAPTAGPAGATDWVYGDRNIGGTSTPAAAAGYPNITVPAGNVAGLPVGISFFGKAWSEATLLRLAYSFEQAAKARIVPRYLMTLA